MLTTLPTVRTRLGTQVATQAVWVACLAKMAQIVRVQCLHFFNPDVHIEQKFTSSHARYDIGKSLTCNSMFFDGETVGYFTFLGHAKKNKNVYRPAPGVRAEWGGMCTCPDGSKFMVTAAPSLSCGADSYKIW